MDLDSALDRYLAIPDVARWLFCTDDVRTVSAQALESCFVYSIGFGKGTPGQPRTMHVEDMLIITGNSGPFLLGVLWGLNQPHLFARTPLMLDKKPIARRFAVDLSAKQALEFMEFVSFEDGKMIVVFRQFLHTHDQSLPVVACARLHAASQLQQTLGPVLMRADIFEAAKCPRCGRTGRRCKCTFESYAPNALVPKSTFSWNQFSARFMNKARMGTIKLRMTAYLPNVGEMRIMDDEVSAINILQKGSTEYLTLLKRKAIHGLGVNILMPRADTKSGLTDTETDFLDLHNSYISRKRIREIDVSESSMMLPSDNILIPDKLWDLPPELPLLPDNITSIPSIADPPDIFQFLTTTADPVESSPIIEEIQTNAQQSLPVVDISQRANSPALSFSAFARQSPEMLMDSFVDPTSVFPAAQQLQQPYDIIQDIENILSPNQVTPPQITEARQPPSEQLPPAYLNQVPQPAVRESVEWTSSVSSEEAASNSIPKPPIVQRRKRARISVKRAKASTTNDNASESDKKHLCEKCPKRFKMRGDLLRHVKTVHEGKKMYTCKECGKAFGHSGHLNRHFSSVHLQQRRFQCQFCGFPFFQASHLQSHIRHIHSAKKPFECTTCGLRLNSQSALKIHVAKSKCGEFGNNGMKCPVGGCVASFASQVELDAHTALLHQNVDITVTQGAPFQTLLS